MSKNVERSDFREFVFTATGRETTLKDLPSVDVFDNLAVEIDRLDAVAELLTSSKVDEVEPRILPGVGLLLKDIRARMETILRFGFKETRLQERSS